MNPNLTILTHDHAVHAIGLTVADVDPTLRRVALAVCLIHVAQPSPTGRADPECWACAGKGSYDQDGEREHCHCRCPWCVGCSQPVCDGPCETIAAIGGALDIEGLG